MRRFLIAIALVALAGLIVWFITRSVRTEPIAPTPPVSKETSKTDQLEVKSDDQHDAPSRTAAEALTPQPPPRADATPKADCYIFGRVIDTTGAPIEGADLRLSAAGHWSDDVEPPLVEIFGKPRPMFVTRSGKDGRFRFEVRLPTAESVGLWAEGDAFHGFDRRQFGSIGGLEDPKPKLVRGENDMGDLVLRTMGAIRGHVTDAGGKPLTGIRLSISGVNGSPYSSIVSDSDGKFECGRLTPGTWSIELTTAGMLAAKHDGVVVQAGITTEGVDFRLEPGPTISGVVVDPNGAPLADVTLNGLPESAKGGWGASARSDEHGVFVMTLQQSDPYCLYLRDQPQFEPWGGERPEDVFAPGTKDVRIVLTPITSTTFRVVDASSGSPIERFGLRIRQAESRNGSSWSPDRSPPQQDIHASGEVSLPAKPGQAWAMVMASGHGPVDVGVKWDNQDQPLQTIRLAAGGSLLGQVSFAGRTIASAKVKLSDDRGRREPGDRTPHLTLFTGRDQFVTTDEQGRFEFHDLAAGIYLITIDSAIGARVVKSGIHVQVGTATDLGVIVPEVGATIRVHLKVAPGADASGLAVFTGLYGDRRADVPDADGALVFNGMEAGTHELTLVRHPPLVPEPMKQKVTIATGERRDVEFDLVPHELCKVTVHVAQNGEAVGWVHVRCQLVSNGFVTKELDVGTTNDEGIATGVCPGDCDVRFLARSKTGVFLGQADDVVHLPASGAHEASLALSTGELTVQLPSRVTVPERGIVSVTLTPVLPAGASPIELRAATKTSFEQDRGSAEWKGSTVAFGDFAAGEYDVVVNIRRFDKEASGKANAWTRTDVVPTFKTRLVLEAGKSATIEVP